MGLNPNLEEAMKMAVRETIRFITQRFPKLSWEEAYMIASVAVDYHITPRAGEASRRARTIRRARSEDTRWPAKRVVDGTKGIHGMIPKAIFTSQ
jgi:acetamidase/formamidase